MYKSFSAVTHLPYPNFPMMAVYQIFSSSFSSEVGLGWEGPLKEGPLKEGPLKEGPLKEGHQLVSQFLDLAPVVFPRGVWSLYQQLAPWLVVELHLVGQKSFPSGVTGFWFLKVWTCLVR